MARSPTELGAGQRRSEDPQQPGRWHQPTGSALKPQREKRHDREEDLRAPSRDTET